MKIRALVWHGVNYIKRLLFVYIPWPLFVPLPTNIYITPTQLCNSKCIMCLSWRDDGSKDLSFSLWKKAVDTIARIAPYSKINISGGEILLPGLLHDIAFYTVKKLPYTGIVTNGFLIDRKMARKLIAAGFSNINLSIDGMRPETVNLIRGRRYAYATTQNAMKLLANEIKRTGSHTKVIVKSIIMGLNVTELPDLVRTVKQMGLHGIYFQPIEPIYNSKQTFAELKKSTLWIQEADRQRAMRIFNTLVTMKKEGYPILNEVKNIEGMKHYFELEGDGIRVPVKNCTIDLSNLFLSEKGDISFCSTYPALGNIRTMSIEHALCTPHARFLRKRIRACGKRNSCMSTCKSDKSLIQQLKLFLFLNIKNVFT